MGKGDLAIRVRDMALLMAEVAGEMQYYGGFDVWYKLHSEELANAAVTALEWYESIEEELDGQ